jgi:hypothetical protein
VVAATVGAVGSFVVPAELRPWVEEIDVATAGGVVAVDAPDHAVALVVRAGRDVAVMGPRTRAAYHVSEPGRSCVRIRMRAGRARDLLGRPVRDLADRIVRETADVQPG